MIAKLKRNAEKAQHLHRCRRCHCEFISARRPALYCDKCRPVANRPPPKPEVAPE